MKKLLSILLSSFLLIIAASAQKLKEAQVPNAAKSAFTKAHPNMKGEWEKEDGNYEVVFKMGSKSISSVITKAGTILSTETELAANELPQTVTTYIVQHYKAPKIKGAAKIVKDNGEVSYEAGVNGKELIFDTNGKLMKNVKEEKEDKDGKKEKD